MKGWCANRRMAAKVLHTDCIHAADGSPLYLQLDDNFHDLRQRFLPNIGRFRALAGFAPEVVLTVTIDRGIYDLDTSWAKNRESDSRLKIVQKTDFTEVWIRTAKSVSPAENAPNSQMWPVPNWLSGIRNPVSGFRFSAIRNPQSAIRDPRFLRIRAFAGRDSALA